jgi:hypothetical protein
MIPLREIRQNLEVRMDTSLKHKVSNKQLAKQWIIHVVRHCLLFV